MNNKQILIGSLSACPGPVATAPAVKLVALINTRIRPPRPLQPEQVHIRSLRLVSDAVNDHGGRFPVTEHARLCDLVIDSPVLIGHDRSRLPVARNFAACCSREGEHHWVTVWFYWMRGAAGDRLAADIDGGVVREGSIGFEFRRPQCSICGDDIRRCDHIPGRTYADRNGTARAAHYEYRDIVRVLETSLVYRGATPGTRLGNEPVFCKTGPPPRDVSKPVDHPLRTDETLLGLVLDRSELPHGCRRYVIARRDPGDPVACEELSIVTTARFAIGDMVKREHGCWSVLSSRKRKDNEHDTQHDYGSRVAGDMASCHRCCDRDVDRRTDGLLHDRDANPPDGQRKSRPGHGGSDRSTPGCD